MSFAAFPNPTPLVRRQSSIHLEATAAAHSSATPLDFPLTTTLTVYGSLPSYAPSLTDGTLLTQTYLGAHRDANVLLFIGGIVLAVFLRNIVVASKYVRAIAARDKSLFYLLLFAQIWGPIAVLAMLLPLAVDSANCTATNLVAAVALQISFATLLSGILGIKAYRCLNQSKAVLVAMSITQLASLALSAADIPNFKSSRTVAGTCELTGELKLIPMAFILSTIETLVFVGMCFGYAIWNASKRSANLGRLSLDLSNEPAGMRGWWDYAPTIVGAATATNAPSIARSNSMSTTGRDDPALGGTMITARSGVSRAQTDTLTLGSLARNGVRSANVDGTWEKIGDQERGQAGSRGSDRRGSQPDDEEEPKFTRIVLLNDVVKNELFYTGCILACHTPMMIMFPVSAEYNLWPPVFWLAISWCLTSVLVIRSFTAVVKRHEREAILREPLTAWGPDPMDMPSGPPRPKQTPWGRAISVSTGSVMSFPVVRRRGSTATSAAQSVAFSNAAHSQAFHTNKWANGTFLSAKGSKVNLSSSAPQSANSSTLNNSSTGRPTVAPTPRAGQPSKLKSGTTATALRPLNSQTTWNGSSVAAGSRDPFADPARTPNLVSNLVDVTELPTSPEGTNAPPEAWRRGSVSGLTSANLYNSVFAQQQAGPASSSRRRPSLGRRGSADHPPTSSRRGSAAGLNLIPVPLVAIGEAATPLATTFDLVELEPRRPRSDADAAPFHLVEPGEAGLDPLSQQHALPASSTVSVSLLDLEGQPRTQIRDASPLRAAEQRRVRDGSRTIAFDLDLGVLPPAADQQQERGRSRSAERERRQFGSADALLHPGVVSSRRR